MTYKKREALGPLLCRYTFGADMGWWDINLPQVIVPATSMDADEILSDDTIGPVT